MVDTPAPYGPQGYAARAGGPGSAATDDWGPATSVRSASAQQGAPRRYAPPVRESEPPPYQPEPRQQPPRQPREQSDGRRWQEQAAHSGHGLRDGQGLPVGRGLPGWAALVVLLVIAGIGGLIDTASGTQARGGFNIAIIIASIVAILVVRRSAMFPIVIAPPIVYSVASGGMLYLRSGGLHDHKVLFDAAANWLVYGFPAMAAATAAVLIIAGVRLVVRR